MKIFIDASGLKEPITGLTNYSFNLLKEILLINTNIKFTVLCSKSGSKNLTKFLEKDTNVKVIYSNIPNVGPMRDLKYLNLYRIINKHDLYHCLSSYLPFFKIKTKTLITIHDLKYIKIDNLMNNRIKSFYLKFILKRSLKIADKIIAISKSTASDIKDVIGPNKKTFVVYEANTLDKKQLIEPVESNKLPKFFLCIGENRPHKNYNRVLEAYSKGYLECGEGFPDLFIAGNNVDDLKDQVIKFGIEKKVSLLGLVPNSKILWLYKNAYALLYVSLYEGFGLPLLEAMSSELPVITTNMHSTKEISGGAALLVNPESVNEISKALVEIFQNEFLRKEYIQKGLERERFFSWPKAANQTIDIYNEVNLI